MVPSGMAMSTAMMPAMTAIWNDTGILMAISLVTGSPVHNDLPRSKRVRPTM